MRQPLPARTALAAGLSVAAVLLAGCAASPTPPSSSAATGVPQADVDGYAPLTVHLVAADGAAPPGMTGQEFGCGDLLVPVQTVPVHPQDPLVTALDFLTQDTAGEHGEPALTNAVLEAAPDLAATGHRREGDTEVVSFTGAVAPADECQAQRVRAQLQETARAQTSAGRVRLEVDGQDLDALLGLPPLALGQASSGSAAPATTAPAPSTTTPVEPASPAPTTSEPASSEPASPSTAPAPSSDEPTPTTEPTEEPTSRPSSTESADESTAPPSSVAPTSTGPDAPEPSPTRSSSAPTPEPDASGTDGSARPSGAASNGSEESPSSGSADASPSDG